MKWWKIAPLNWRSSMVGRRKTFPKMIMRRPNLLPESEPGDPLPGATGHHVPNSIEDDEDDEGRSIGEQLVSGGLNEAEHDQMLQAAKDAEKNDPTEKTDR
jgi:hypothetical protein